MSLDRAKSEADRLSRVLSMLKRARARIEELEQRRQLDQPANEPIAKEPTAQEPIAVIGIGCRFPGGAVSPDRFWELLREGFDGTCEIPADRFEWQRYYSDDVKAPGTIYTSRGAFLDSIDTFDAPFFGISPREAERLDPQQRLLLELAWETFEDARIPVHSLRRTKAGVFVGMSTDDYAELCVGVAGGGVGGREAIDMFSSLGNSRSVAAGRISASFGLQGPAMQIDTACSSSLVAVHLACQSLRQRECEMALAGGVNLIISPTSTISRCRMQALARDGRCKTFDAAADGYAQGEGGGFVLLKRLSKAEADGDTIYAVLAGSAVNHNGPSSGLTVPSEEAQRSVIRDALSAAGIAPSAVDYIEAHGTGTALGDPLELNAIAEVVAPRRTGTVASAHTKDRPLLVGSVKTNIGHLEAAAGVACLIKTVLAISHGEIPAHRGLSVPNPRIPWQDLPITIPTATVTWPDKTGPEGASQRVAGVSSFGISGTNAHVIVRSYDQQPEAIGDDSTATPYLVPISGMTEAACREVAGAYAGAFEGKGISLRDVSMSAAVGRSHLAVRKAFVARDLPDLVIKLKRYAAGSGRTSELYDAALHARLRDARPVVFLFTGQGSQYPGMGRDLYESEPIFRNAIARCEKILEGEIDLPLSEVIFDRAHESTLNQTRYTQPAIFAVEYALYELVRSWGIHPHAVIGHSVGEYVAACVAGVMSVEDALQLVASRARLMQTLPHGGAMAAIAAPRDAVVEAIASSGIPVSIAAVNSPTSTVISGLEAEVEAITARFDQCGIGSVKLTVSHAFHSALMDPILEQFRTRARALHYNAPNLPIAFNITGDLSSDRVIDAEYWVRHLRGTVEFERGISAILRAGYDTFLELGPRPILSALGRECSTKTTAKSATSAVLWTAALRPGARDREQIFSAVGELFARGVDLSWSEMLGRVKRRPISLPLYQWQRKRYWIQQEQLTVVAAQAGVSPDLYQIVSEVVGVLDERITPALVPLLVVIGSESSCRDDVRRAVDSLRTRWTSIPNIEIVTAGAVDILHIASGTHVVYVSDATHDLAGDHLTLAVEREVGVIQSLTRDLTNSFQLSVVVVTRDRDASGGVLAAAITALGRSIALEHPRMWGASLVCAPEQIALGLTAVTSSAARHDALTCDRTSIRGDRLRRMQSCKPHEFRVRGDRSYLITGGAGSVGREISAWLLKRGAGQVIVTGRRSADDPYIKQLIRDTIGTDTQGRLSYEQCDCASEQALSRLLASSCDRYLPIAGVWHLAGVADQQPFVELEASSVHAILQSKVAGALALEKVTSTLQLENFVLFSSLSAVIGSSGHAVYGAANGALDAIAERMTKRGIAAVSVAFGPWEHGIFEDKGTNAVVVHLAKQGIHALTTHAAITALERALAIGTSRVVVAAIDWQRFRGVYEGAGAKPIVDLIESAEKRPSLLPVRARVELSTDPARRTQQISEILAAEVAAILKLESPDEVDRDFGFFEMGMDSLLAVELKERVEGAFAIDLPQTTVFNFPSITLLARYLDQKVLTLDPGTQSAGAMHGIRPSVTREKTTSPAALSAKAITELSAAELEAIVDAELARLSENEP